MDDRLHVEAAFDYLRNSGQTSQASRPWGSHRTALLTNPNYTATNGQPRLIIADHFTFSTMQPGGVLGRTSGIALDRTRVVEGTRVSLRVSLGVGTPIKKNN